MESWVKHRGYSHTHNPHTESAQWQKVKGTYDRGLKMWNTHFRFSPHLLSIWKKNGKRWNTVAQWASTWSDETAASTQPTSYTLRARCCFPFAVECVVCCRFGLYVLCVCVSVCCFREVLAFQCYFHINKTHIIEFWRLQRLISKHIHCDRIACNVPLIRAKLVTNSDFSMVLIRLPRISSIFAIMWHLYIWPKCVFFAHLTIPSKICLL